MRRALGLTFVVLLFSCFAFAQKPVQPLFWKGKFQIYQLNFSFGTRTERNRTEVHRGADLWKYEYELYQNADGVARQELTSMNRNRTVEGPLDVRLMDYSRGSGIVFDKGGKDALSGPLVPVPGRRSSQRRILGFDCEGKEYDWTTFQGAKVNLQSWSAQDSTLKVPLLEVEYFTDDKGSLLALTIQVVSEIEPVSQLPDSLFQFPRGLHVVKAPSVR